MLEEFKKFAMRGNVVDLAVAVIIGAALKLQDKLAPLHINLFIESNPAPVKFALSLIGKCASALRLPMVPASEKAQGAVRQAMVHAGLIN